MDETITEQLRERTFAFLSNNNIELPIEVKNSLSDVFDENDFTGDDSVNIYFKEDLEDFLTETMLIKKLNVQVTGGNSSGFILEKYSYYGELDAKPGYSEDIALYNGEEKINQLSFVEPAGINSLEDENDYCIVLIEESEFHMGEYTVTPRVYFYIPKSGEGIE